MCINIMYKGEMIDTPQELKELFPELEIENFIREEYYDKQAIIETLNNDPGGGCFCPFDKEAMLESLGLKYKYDGVYYEIIEGQSGIKN